nr:hypothetical protein [Tanacetum cinerariifolium]
MDPYNNSTLISIKLTILDAGKFKQWKFRIQPYLQHEYYALWEVIMFGDSYKAPPDGTAKDKGPAAIDGIGCHWSYMDEEDEASKNHALVADEEEMGLPEFVDGTVSDYTRPTPSIDVSKSIKIKKKDVKVIILLSLNKEDHLGKPRQGPFSNARPTLKSAQPKMTFFVKTTHSNVKRPFERKSAAKNKVWSPTVRPKIPIAGLKVPTAKPAVAADKGNKGIAVKASACWI